MDLGLVNAFLALEDLTESEQMLKQNVLGLNDLLKKVNDERLASTETLQKKEQEFLKVQGALENQLAVVEQLARRRGLEPLLPEEQPQATEEVVPEVVSQPVA